MKIGMIGLGRMGSNMVRRLQRAGHSCLVYDPHSQIARGLERDGASAASSPLALLAGLPDPRVVWMMIPAGAVDALIETVSPQLRSGDVLIDGGNSFYGDDVRRAAALAGRGVRYLDVGTSGGLWGLERGYCLMVGGDDEAVRLVEPVLAALAPGEAAGASAAAGTARAGGTAPRGYLHVGPSGAGHFVKMVHNGIEYGLMAAYAEGFNLLHRATLQEPEGPADAEVAPVSARWPQHMDLKLEQIAELWRHGSVISSWLLDLLAAQLAQDPGLAQFAGRVSDSGEGRWTVQAAIDAGAPVPVLATALFERFSSRGHAELADRMLSAMRLGFGGHHETAAS